MGGGAGFSAESAAPGKKVIRFNALLSETRLAPKMIKNGSEGKSFWNQILTKKIFLLFGTRLRRKSACPKL